MKIPSSRVIKSVAVTLCGGIMFSLAGCKDKPATDPESAAEEAAESVASEPAVEIDPSSYNSKRTQAFGFLSRLPASTEGAIGVRNLSDMIGGILDSNTVKRAMAMAQDMGAEPDPQGMQMVQAMIDQYVGKEMFVIFSQGSGAQLSRLQSISGAMNDANMRTAGAAAAGDGARTDTGAAMLEGIRNQLKDEDSDLSQALKDFQFPPLIVGSKVADGAQEVIDQLIATEASLPPIFTVSKVKVGGAEFTSWKVKLQDVITEAMVAEMNEFLQDEASTNRVANILREKTIEFTFGKLDNYLVFALGNDHKHLDFVSKPEDSILAASAFGFGDQFLDKKLFGYSFMSKPFLAGANQPGQIERMADSFASGLATGGAPMKKFGDSLKKLAGHIEKFSTREPQTYVGITYMENGLRGESIGGYMTDTQDFKAKSQFANSAPADAAVVISSVANPEYRGESIAMMETMFEAIEAGVGAFSGGEGQAFDQYQEMKQAFGGDLTKIWGIMKGKLLDGLGSQSGIIVDLNGGMPKGIPGLPIVLQDQGKIPRIAMATDVKDRAKLAEALAELVPAINEMMTKIPGQQPGSEAQVPDVVSDDGGDLTTHYFPLPFVTKDFVPSISLNDELFFLSTSKQFSQALAAGSKGGDGDIHGTYVMMNFAAMHRFAEGWMKLLLRNGDEIFPDESAVEEFKMGAAQAQQFLEFTRGIRSLKVNRYQTDEGAMRSSWHLHVEDIGPAID